jgi:MFS transporter
MSLFRNPRFTAASASVAIAFFALLGFIFLMTQYFQVVRGYSPLSTGVRLLPVAVSVGVASVVGTRLAVRVGNKAIVGGGMALFCAALLWISAASQDTPYAIIAVQMVVLGVGMGFTQAPATESIMGAVPREKAGIASAVNGSTRLFGGTLGVAVIGSVAASLYTSRLAALLPPGLPGRAITAAKGSVGGAATAAQQLAQAGVAGPARRLAAAASAAFMHSLTGACLVAAGVTAIGVVLVAFWLPARPRAEPADAQRAATSMPPTGAHKGDQGHP